MSRVSQEDFDNEIRKIRRKFCTINNDIDNLLPQDIIDALNNANSPDVVNVFSTLADLASIGIGTNIYWAEDFDDLPDATLHTGEYYWVENNQGTQWLPGSLGGTYHPKGLYYSNGVSWITVDAPINSPQSEVNTGLNDNRFVTPSTLKNSTQWSTKADSVHNHNDLYYLDSEVDILLAGKANSLGPDDNYVTDAEKIVIGNTSGINTGDQDLSGKSNVGHTHTASEITGVKRYITFNIEETGGITLGLKDITLIPFNGVITKWTLISEVVGDVEIDILTDSTIPTELDSITSGLYPTLNSEQIATANVTWNIDLGDLLRFSIISTDLEKVTLQLEVTT